MKKINKTSKILILAVLLVAIIPLVQAQSASFTFQEQLFFTGSSSDPSTLYQDGIGGNQDVGIRLCDLGQRHAGATYAMNVNGNFINVLVSYYSSSTALSFTDLPSGGGCFDTSPGFMTVSPSELTTPNPDVFKAAFPANLWIGYSTQANPGTISDFVFAGSQARLRGSYSVTRSFNQAANQVSVQAPQITFQTPSGSFSRSATDPDFGIASDRRMVAGLCQDEFGASCNAGEILSTPTFPRNYNTGIGVGDINDQNTHERWVVFNGIGNDMCIGANLNPTITLVDPDPIYYSQTLNISFFVANPRDTPTERQGGNVEVTSSFTTRVTIFEQGNPSNVVFSQDFLITENLPPNGQVSREVQWPAFEQSGIYTVRVEADINDDIAECNENDNVAQQNFELRPITIPEIFIDGVETAVFPQANIPYNLSLHLRNSDGDTLSNATVRIIERNGLNLMAPTQIYNHTIDGSTQIQSGLVTQNQVGFITDFFGNASFTFIPTYNQLYLAQYDYLQVEEHIGGHELYLEGEQSDGEEFRFIENEVLLEKYFFDIQNKDSNITFVQKDLPNQLIATQVLDFIYHTFANFLKSIS